MVLLMEVVGGPLRQQQEPRSSSSSSVDRRGSPPSRRPHTAPIGALIGRAACCLLGCDEEPLLFGRAD